MITYTNTVQLWTPGNSHWLFMHLPSRTCLIINFKCSSDVFILDSPVKACIFFQFWYVLDTLSRKNRTLKLVSLLILTSLFTDAFWPKPSSAWQSATDDGLGQNASVNKLVKISYETSLRVRFFYFKLTVFFTHTQDRLYFGSRARLSLQNVLDTSITYICIWGRDR